MAMLLTAWCVWLFRSRVDIYVRSSSARLEVSQSAVQVNAPVEGVVVACDLSLGRHVLEGDLLARLDARTYELQSNEKRATMAARRAVADALKKQLAAQSRARASVAEVVGNTARMGRARALAGKQNSTLKQEENEIMGRLREAQVASKLDALRTKSEAEALRLQADLALDQAALETSSAKTTLSDRDVQLTSLAKEIVDVENDLAVEEARLRTLEYEVERRSLRASVAGTLTDVVPCTAGMSVGTTQRLATILPEGEVRLVAYFDPKEAIGRVQPGQRAILRVESYPWTQFGTLDAVVRTAGAEARDGVIRVEMTVLETNPRIPVVHGLVASAEVATEKMTPATLLLRMAGQPWAVAAPAAPPPPSANGSAAR